MPFFPTFMVGVSMIFVGAMWFLVTSKALGRVTNVHITIAVMLTVIFEFWALSHVGYATANSAILACWLGIPFATFIGCMLHVSTRMLRKELDIDVSNTR